MATPIEMPKLSDTMTEGTLLAWRKKPGDKITVGDVLAEVETDKATMEMEAFDDGVLAEIYIEAGGKAAVGQKLALLLAPGEKPGAPAPAPAAPAPATAAAAPAPVAAAAQPAAAPAAANHAAEPGARVKSSPLARKTAQAEGVDLATLAGTGPGGRIIQKDVLAAATPAPATPAPAAPAPKPAAAPAAPAAPAPGDRIVPLSGMRRVIAERLLFSKNNLPHFYLNIDVNAGPLLAFRAEINEKSQAIGGPKFTVNDLVLKATALAARKVPAVNASFLGDSIIYYENIHLSVAVAVEDGLVTPVIRDADRKTLTEINHAVKDFAARARDKKLKPDEYQGGTLTVSNLGGYGIDRFNAIVNPPQAAILAIGAAKKVPVVNDKDEIVVGHLMNIGLSGDHRVVDGAVGAEFINALRKLLENPLAIVL